MVATRWTRWHHSRDGRTVAIANLRTGTVHVTVANTSARKPLLVHGPDTTVNDAALDYNGGRLIVAMNNNQRLLIYGLKIDEDGWLTAEALYGVNVHPLVELGAKRPTSRTRLVWCEPCRLILIDVGLSKYTAVCVPSDNHSPEHNGLIFNTSQYVCGGPVAITVVDRVAFCFPSPHNPGSLVVRNVNWPNAPSTLASQTRSDEHITTVLSLNGFGIVAVAVGYSKGTVVLYSAHGMIPATRIPGAANGRPVTAITTHSKLEDRMSYRVAFADLSGRVFVADMQRMRDRPLAVRHVFTMRPAPVSLAFSARGDSVFATNNTGVWRVVNTEQVYRPRRLLGKRTLPPECRRTCAPFERVLVDQALALVMAYAASADDISALSCVSVRLHQRCASESTCTAVSKLAYPDTVAKKMVEPHTLRDYMFEWRYAQKCASMSDMHVAASGLAHVMEKRKLMLPRGVDIRSFMFHSESARAVPAIATKHYPHRSHPAYSRSLPPPTCSLFIDAAIHHPAVCVLDPLRILRLVALSSDIYAFRRVIRHTEIAKALEEATGKRSAESIFSITETSESQLSDVEQALLHTMVSVDTIDVIGERSIAVTKRAIRQQVTELHPHLQLRAYPHEAEAVAGALVRTRL